ncbi:acetyl-CoA carboxylase carboxyltransferase subunit alpha [Aquifex aeolicus]|uniref:Acetyl-coenzyme A carboxylase carboxyl transferase subunit alpha n=1 Tax=Aquifex aeolicus (strain VF5) TaxID=224324 RepID=ACCA_AQUAE|nr:acetyl-CoA carboxylase carboxyltransferase subunit alpha [Aquifex aeolicus]O67260.1 RecName: Full=Acetyl-coenzyme A carboxylase carboxyl transferase subunit alpha; Short=ACCase subunit alpha; Short=Acetyl-CoA carboxylase carboxyltransferase subunit alpha [Aquifex aeolicus VF5]AAC07216.1 acetyl-CoA carboxylase alpha subunit [Aquifex aeolicus VF5]
MILFKVMHLEFEKELLEIKEKIDRLLGLYRLGKEEVLSELDELRKKFKEKARKIYRDLSPWERVQVARHPKRPHTSDYIKYLIKDFEEVHGDTCYGDDKAVIAGFGYFRGKPVAVVGHEKGKDTKEKLERNFGMPHPEGYRKAIKVFKLAERYNIPVITFIDTPGAFPGIGAEERGQSRAIAESMLTMAFLKVPSVAVVIGEGGSGGALAFGVANRVCILENAYYSVISPEGCAAILWKDQSKVKEAAKALRLTAKDLKELGVVDCVIPEPYGAAHWSPRGTAMMVGMTLKKCLDELSKLTEEGVVRSRLEKFKNMGAFKIAS